MDKKKLDSIYRLYCEFFQESLKTIPYILSYYGMTEKCERFKRTMVPMKRKEFLKSIRELDEEKIKEFHNVLENGYKRAVDGRLLIEQIVVYLNVRLIDIAI